MEMVHDRCSTLLTEFSTALTTILPILFQYFCKYGYSDSRNLCAVESDSTHHFFGNACTMSESLRFSQFSGRLLILSVYILMSFDVPFGRLFGVR